MSTFPVVLDANVLVPMSLRDTLLIAAEVGLYRPHWSHNILAEARATLLRLPQLRMTDAQADKMIGGMLTAFPDALVGGYEPLIEVMQNDPGDRHVLAVAVRVHASVIVTMNTKHFSASALDPWDIEAQRPDQFLTGLFDLNPEAMLRVIQTQAAQTQRPTLTVERVLSNVELFAPTFVERVRAARREHG